jgi:arylsulfatase
MTGELDLPSDGTSGVIVAQSGLYSGYALYLVDGELRYEYNAFNENRYKIRSSKKVPTEDSVVKAVYKVGMPNGTGPDRGTATVTLFINGEQGWRRQDRTHRASYLLAIGNFRHRCRYGDAGLEGLHPNTRQRYPGSRQEGDRANY